MTPVAGERRRQRREPIRLPVRVQARDPDGALWEEMARCEDAGADGLSLHLARTVRIGQLLHLSLALPARLRRHDLTDSAYRVYGLVRHMARDAAAGGVRVGVLFLGAQPPRDARSLPAELFLMPGHPEPVERRRHPRHCLRLSLRLEAEDAPGDGARTETVETEDVGAWGAKVRAATLPAGTGSLLRVAEPGGDFATRAEVRSVSIGPDGASRLSLLFLDRSLPERLLPPTAAP
jgi:hypothetical protein